MVQYIYRNIWWDAFKLLTSIISLKHKVPMKGIGPAKS